ncbi:hypothetical protein [Robertmurraya siralis]|nr:hypothetical protein [Robertmurraya siralis]
MIVAGTEFFRSFKEREYIIKNLKQKYKHVKLSIAGNMIIFQYDDGVKQ